MSVRLVLADDHPLILGGLATLFTMEEGFEVVDTCKDGEDALRAARLHRPDVIILDLRMPGMNGIDVARRVIEEKLPTRIVLLTAALGEEDVIEAVQLGVHGVVLKETSPDLLIECIRKVHAGEQWMERRATKRALEKMLQRENAGREVSAALTAREVELVRAVARGLRNKDIADKLCISEGTVKVHLHNIYEKLNVDGRMALLRYAQEKGLV